jgi:bifunctional pyridoxal-dependent enzyme with beta-cystathionase and maltose regulon repressor activities
MFQPGKNTIFLDIDGVLATHKEFMMTRHKFHKKYDEANRLHIPYPFNPGCVKVFNSILQETDAQIVLSSDWRHHWDLEELDGIFQFNKVIKSPIAVTGNYPISMGNLEKNRVNEIEKFIQTHDVGQYVIIDDLHMDIYIKDRFVKTIDMEGLKQTGIKKKILKFLTNESKQESADNKGQTSKP